MRQHQVKTRAPAGSALGGSVIGSERPNFMDLPPPRKSGGMPLISALQQRHSNSRIFGSANSETASVRFVVGGFRHQSPERRPYRALLASCNGDRFGVALADGVFVYEPIAHTLLRHLADDIRGADWSSGFRSDRSTQPDLCCPRRAHDGYLRREERRLYASVDAAFVGQNVYLFCASEGLATVFRGAVDYPKLARTLRLSNQQFVTFAQTVGYPRI